jgi:hypothetical protein
MFRYATSLAARRGLLWSARWSGAWRVAVHDFDGRARGAGFAVPPEEGTRPAVTAIAVDEDLRVWIADAGAGRVRAFSAFGRELAGLPRGTADRAGEIVDPAGLDAAGVEDGARLLVASRSPRRHGLHLARADGRGSVALRPRDLERGHAGLARCAFGPRGIVRACEPSTGLVLAWRDGQFHSAFPAPLGGVPRALRALEDGRIVLASSNEQGGALTLHDASGRLERVLARGADGDLEEPEDLALDPGDGGDRRARVVVADRAGTRLAVWNLAGDSYGAFEDASPRAADRP